MSTMPIPDADDRDLVQVFDTQEESEAQVVRGLLESAGIEALITGLVGPQDVLPVGGVVVQVAAENAEEAMRVIEDYRANAPAEDEEPQQ